MARSPKVGPKKISNQTSSSAVRKAYVPPTSSSSQQVLNVEEREELRKLAAILPASSKNSDPTDVVLRAATYIDQLVATVQARVKSGTLPIEALNALPPTSRSRTTTAVNRKPRRSMEKKR